MLKRESRSAVDSSILQAPNSSAKCHGQPSIMHSTDKVLFKRELHCLVCCYPACLQQKHLEGAASAMLTITISRDQSQLKEMKLMMRKTIHN